MVLRAISVAWAPCIAIHSTATSCPGRTTPSTHGACASTLSSTSMTSRPSDQRNAAMGSTCRLREGAQGALRQPDRGGRHGFYRYGDRQRRRRRARCQKVTPLHGLFDTVLSTNWVVVPISWIFRPILVHGPAVAERVRGDISSYGFMGLFRSSLAEHGSPAPLGARCAPSAALSARTPTLGRFRKTRTSWLRWLWSGC